MMDGNNKLSPVTTWSNISSINGDTLDITSSNSLLNPKMSHVPSIKSEILTSSNNLRNLLLKRKQNNQQIATSSVKQYNFNENKCDQFLMPPPVKSTIYRTYKKTQDKINMSSNNKKTASPVLDSPAQFFLPNLSMKNISSCISTNISKHYPQSYIASGISTNNLQVERIFSRWKIMLNNQYELIIKGTLKCGKIAHSKPVVRRYTATCIESKFKHKYYLEGNIVDETNELPDYVRGKFYNGFPDDWENVYQIWRTYINQECPVTFRWPTPITDSDDDLNSEITDLTYIRVKNIKAISKTKSYKSAEHIQFECSSNKSPEKKEKHRNCSTYNSQSYEKNALFTKSFVPESKNNSASITQINNVSLACDGDIEQNFKSNVKTSSPRKMTKLKDYIQEDKLNIIINNLVDKNCSQTYINKIVEMFDCLNYVASYETPSECNYDSIVIAKQDTSKSKQIPQQEIVMHDNCVDIKKIENRMTKLKNVYSTDPGYESVKNNFIATHQSNPINTEPEHDGNKDSDESESEIYAGIPKIPIKQILRHRERVYKRPVKKKMISKQCAMIRQHNAREIGFESDIETANSIANAKETLLSIPCTNTHNEVTNIGRRHKATVVHQRPHKTTFFTNQEIPRNNIDIHNGNKPAVRMQNQQFAFDTQETNLNVFIKKPKVSHGIAKFSQQAHSSVISDVDYAIDSDVDIITVDTNMQKSSGNTMPHIYSNEGTVISNKSNNNFPEKSHAPRRLCREFIGRSKNEIAMKKSESTIINSTPINLNLKINNTGLNLAQSHDSDTIVKGKQYANNRSTEEVHTTELFTKSAIIANDSHSKMTADNEKETHLNKKNSMMNPATEQSDSDIHPKVLIAWMPKVVQCAKSTYKLGLIFQGKLLNEAGHVSNRNFITDVILKRLSETLVETVNHEFYELRGHLNNNKYNIPKKLAIQCRNGCPMDIKQFCLTWETLQNGESTSLKDNNPVYNSDNSQESFASLEEDSNEPLNIKEAKQQKIDSQSASKIQSMDKQLFESTENSNTNRKQISEVKTASITKKADNAKTFTINGKRRIAKQLTYTSTDNEEEEVASPCKRLRNSQPKICADEEPMNMQTSSFYSSLQSKASHKSTTKSNYATYCSAMKNAGNNVMYTYYKNVPTPDDSLSEDQTSILGDNNMKISKFY